MESISAMALKIVNDKAAVSSARRLTTNIRRAGLGAPAALPRHARGIRRGGRRVLRARSRGKDSRDRRGDYGRRRRRPRGAGGGDSGREPAGVKKRARPGGVVSLLFAFACFALIPIVLSAKSQCSQTKRLGSFALIPIVLSAKCVCPRGVQLFGFALIPIVLSAKLKLPPAFVAFWLCLDSNCSFGKIEGQKMACRTVLCLDSNCSFGNALP